MPRLLEVLLIEALRSTNLTNASQGLLRGLADERLAVAIRLMHESPKSPWTVVELAKEAALSRSAFFVRFNDGEIYLDTTPNSDVVSFTIQLPLAAL